LRDEDAAVVSINLAEALDVLMRRDGISAGEVRGLLGPLLQDYLAVRSPGVRHAWRASHLRQQYYRRRRAELSLADCFLVAAARAGESVATSDPAVLEMARAEEVDVVALPQTG
jgi:uncharacterized protein with PIN domain